MKFMREITVLLFLISVLVFSTTGFATDDNLKYFMVLGKLKPKVAQFLVENPSDPTESAIKSIESIPGAKLVDYYLEAGSAQNIAIIAVPDTSYAAALVYQRMASGSLIDINVREIIPAKKFKDVMEFAQSIK